MRVVFSPPLQNYQLLRISHRFTGNTTGFIGGAGSLLHPRFLVGTCCSFFRFCFTLKYLWNSYPSLLFHKCDLDITEIHVSAGCIYLECDMTWHENCIISIFNCNDKLFWFSHCTFSWSQSDSFLIITHYSTTPDITSGAETAYHLRVPVSTSMFCCRDAQSLIVCIFTHYRIRIDITVPKRK